ncbi:hypothetical protein KC343_g10855, partial [Hortaea werneckii]
GDFDDAQWDQEMQRRFGDQYYAQDEEGADGSDVEMEDGEVGGGGKKKAKKPKWDDDIDIHDLVPDFKDKDENPNITLSDDDEADGDAEGGGAPLPTVKEEVAVKQEDDSDDSSAPKKKKKTKKDRLQEKADAKRAARKQRAQIEEMVDASLPLQHPTLSTSNKKSGTQPTTPTMGFRYRATSPTSFGLSARDILFADDKQLNEFAGLKKFHSFREEEKKARDRKKFSKKARLRQWRRETFGDVEEPTGGFERVLGRDGGGGVGGGSGKAKGSRDGKGSLKEDAEKVRRAEKSGGEGDNVREGERRKKRRGGKGKKGKGGEVGEV